MLHMVSFGTILDHFGPKATQMLQMVRFGIVLDDFGPKCLKQMILETNLIWKTEVSPILRNFGVALFHAIQRLAFCTERSEDNLGAIRKAFLSE